MELTSSDSISVFDSLRRRMMMPEQWTFTEPLKVSNRWSQQMTEALKAHWPEYLMEASRALLVHDLGLRFYGAALSPCFAGYSSHSE